jgi:hypothetical protein
MIAICDPQSAISSKADNHAAFLKLLPAIRRAAQISFRKAGPELRDDMVSEVIARAYVGFAALAERGQLERALPTPLARYAIAQVRAGRRVGSRLRIRDVMSQYAQFQKCFVVERLDKFDDEENCWEQLVVEDRRATPADVAICRIDFAAWLRSLGARIRKIALALARGETTTTVAKMFNVTAARISQLREWLKKSWEAFHGEGVIRKRLRRGIASRINIYQLHYEVRVGASR